MAAHSSPCALRNRRLGLLVLMSHNQLTALPPELGQLQNLTSLDLRGNPLLDCLPAGWRNQGIYIQPADHPPPLYRVSKRGQA